MNLRSNFFQVLLVLGITVQIGHSATCPERNVIEPYCSCTALSYGLKMECDGTVVENSEQIKDIFLHPSLQRALIAEFYFYDLNISLPSAIFNTAQIEDVSFHCNGNSFQVAVDAFARQQTRKLSLIHCNLNETDFTFLNGFSKIEEIHVAYAQTNSFLSFPTLEKLTTLKVTETPLFEWLPTGSVPSLSHLRLEGVGKENVKILMKEVVKERYLTIIELPSNGLDTVPKELGQMEQLEQVSLAFNRISVLRNQSLHFAAALTYLSFYKCPLTHIEVDAFKGNFSNTHLRLDGTELRHFDEHVFKPLLEMKFMNEGIIELAETAVECDCNLRWLITENRRFLSHVRNGRCTNGENFEDLKPEDYESCQSTTTRMTTPTSTEAVTMSSTQAAEESTTFVSTTTIMPTTSDITTTSSDSSTLTISATEPDTPTPTANIHTSTSTETITLTSAASVVTTTTTEPTSSTPTAASSSTITEDATSSTVTTTPSVDATTTMSTTSATTEEPSSSTSTVAEETVTSTTPTADTVSLTSSTSDITLTSTVTESTTTVQATTTSELITTSSPATTTETAAVTMSTIPTDDSSTTVLSTFTTSDQTPTGTTADTTTETKTTTTFTISTSVTTETTTLTVTDDSKSTTASSTTADTASTTYSSTSTDESTPSMTTPTTITSTPTSTSTDGTTAAPVSTTTTRITSTTPSSASGTQSTIFTILLAASSVYLLK